jgi:hypothetical protein
VELFPLSAHRRSLEFNSSTRLRAGDGGSSGLSEPSNGLEPLQATPPGGFGRSARRRGSEDRGEDMGEGRRPSDKAGAGRRGRTGSALLRTISTRKRSASARGGRRRLRAQGDADLPADCRESSHCGFNEAEK